MLVVGLMRGLVRNEVVDERSDCLVVHEELFGGK